MEMHLQLLISVCCYLCDYSLAHYLPNALARESEWSGQPYAKYVVSIQTTQPRTHYFGFNHFCVGTIVAPIYVLTASHCVFDRINQTRRLQPEEILIVAGSPNRLRPTEKTRVFNVAKVYAFSPHHISKKHDLALLRLKEMLDLNLTQGLGIAELPVKPPPKQGNCSVLGWGCSSMRAPFAEILMQRSFQLEPRKTCHHIFPVTFRRGMICAIVTPEARQGVCRGDSGGPLFCGNQLTGIVSRGVGCDRRYPVIFVNVFFHRPWIRKIFSKANRMRPQFVGWMCLFMLQCVEN